MDLDFSEEQEMLREMVAGVCANHASLDVLRKLEDDSVGFSPELWKALGELGLLGLTLPEAYGGGGQSMLECAIVYEEFGRALAPSPHFVSALCCGGALARGGSEEQKRAWLPEIASGAAVLTPAWLEPERGFGPEGVQMRARLEDEEVRLSGTKLHVLFASSAQRLLVPARTGDAAEQVDLFLVDPSTAGIELTQQFSLASDTQYRVDFDDVRVPLTERVGPPGSGWAVWNATMLEGIIALAAQAVGGADRALEITVEYAKERKQFDKPLGAFQAIAHYLADAATELDGARILVYEAAWARAAGKPIDRLAPMAKLFACDMYRRLTKMAEQVWGGVGFTLEYDIQLYFRRAKQLQLSWWDTRYLEEQVARSVLDQPAA